MKELDDAKTAFAKISLKHKDKQKAQKDVLTAVESFYQTLKNQPGIFSSGKSTALATSEKDSWYQNTKYAHLVKFILKGSRHTIDHRLVTKNNRKKVPLQLRYRNYVSYNDDGGELYKAYRAIGQRNRRKVVVG